MKLLKKQKEMLKYAQYLPSPEKQDAYKKWVEGPEGRRLAKYGSLRYTLSRLEEKGLIEKSSPGKIPFCKYLKE